MFELVSFQPPWQGCRNDELVQKTHRGCRPEVPDGLEDAAPAGWGELMRACWDQKPLNRPDFGSIGATLQEILGAFEAAHEMESQSSGWSGSMSRWSDSKRRLTTSSLTNQDSSLAVPLLDLEAI